MPLEAPQEGCAPASFHVQRAVGAGVLLRMPLVTGLLMPFKCSVPTFPLMRRRRPTSGTANPRGGSDPYLSSNNEHILDIKFESSLRLDGRESCSYEDIAEAIEEIGGVVAHGLVLKDNVTAVVHTPEGAQILRKVQHLLFATHPLLALHAIFPCHCLPKNVHVCMAPGLPGLAQRS